jgi:hypothetical protein
VKRVEGYKMAEYTKIGTQEKNLLVWSGSSKGLKPKWNAFDRFLELLEDSQWHSLKEIEAEFSIPMDEFAPVLSLFTEFDFVSRKDEGSKVRLNPLGSQFLELPQD